MRRQGGDFFDPVEIHPMPVQIARHHHLVGQVGRERDKITLPTRRRKVRLGGVLKRSDDIPGVLWRGDHGVQKSKQHSIHQ
jgi:hypothetical protein